MAITALLNKEDRSLVGTFKTKTELTALLGDKKAEDFEQVTRKDFKADDKYASFDEMCGKVKAVKEEKPAAEPKANRNNAPALTGPYTILKPFPATAEDHPKMAIWNAIAGNSDCEAAIAACPAEKPKRKTSGVYSFSSEMRYFLKAGYVALGNVEVPAPAEKEAANEAETAAA